MPEKSYYSEKLSALKLKQCYDIASPRIQQYLQAEISKVLDYITNDDLVLELGCGYGRLLKNIAPKAKMVYGIDISKVSIDYAKDYLSNYDNVNLYQMDAKLLTFESDSFDVTLILQNGISAFKTPPEILITESLRVTKTGGVLILTSYSDKIWDTRLEWFADQAKHGLLGELDPEKTKNGLIVCKDGFTASTFTTAVFYDLVMKLDLEADIFEVDDSSIFCVITKK